MSDSSADRDPIEKLADSFVARFRAGERPSIEEYAAKYPDLADEIRELLPALVMMEQDMSIAGAATGPGAQPEGAAVAPRQLGDYVILREIGRGGMGVVYEAVQQSLGRHVALKVLALHDLGGSSHRERFRLEARAAARLHHTNIVPIYGVGDHEGTLFYAMQFIQGHGLDVVFEELRRLRGGLAPPASPVPAQAEALKATSGAAATEAQTMARNLLTGRLGDTDGFELSSEPETHAIEASLPIAAPPGSSPGEAPSSVSTLGNAHSEFAMATENRFYRGVARLGIQVAEALAYAHGQGVLHRDIKPSNLLLDAAGTVWVTDFGLAKAEGADGPTQTGDIVGTLRYMAPERFDGWSDPRSDVYGLGATLYELLTLRPLFEDAHRARLIERVLHEEPLSPRKLDRHIPRDLETIVLKALAKEPAARYATAAALAEDLRRFSDDKPIMARRVGTLERTWRWSRRNPLMAGLAAALLLLMMAVTAASVVTAAHFDRLAQSAARTARDERVARLTAQKARAEAEEQHRQAEKARSEADSQRQRAEANFAKARGAVDDYLTKVSESQLLNVPGLQPLRRDLLQSALGFYQDFLKERGADPSIRAGLAAALYRVATIQRELGSTPEEAESLTKAITLYEVLTRETPDDRALLEGLARCYVQSGALTNAIAIWKSLVAAEPSNARFQSDLAAAHDALGRRKPGADDPDGPLRAHQEALALREALVRIDPENPDYQHALGQTFHRLGGLLQSRRATDALEMFNRAAEHHRAAWARAPQNAYFAQDLASALGQAANIEQSYNRDEKALSMYQDVNAIRKKLATENPAVRDFQLNLRTNYARIGDLQRKMGRFDEAARSWRLARELAERLSTGSAEDLYSLALYQAGTATLVNMGATSDEAKAEFRREADRAIEALRAAIAAGYRNVASIESNGAFASLRERPDFRELVSALRATVKAEAAAKAAPEAQARRQATDFEAAVRADTLAKSAQGNEKEGLKTQEEAMAIRQKLVQSDPQNRALRADLATSQNAVGLLLSDQGRTDEAMNMVMKGIALRESLVKDEPGNAAYRASLGSSYLLLGRIQWKADRLADWARSWHQGCELMEEALRQEPGNPTIRSQIAKAHVNFGDYFWSLGLFRDALDHFNRSILLEPTISSKWWYCNALLRLLEGDVPGYRDLCRQMPQQFPDSLYDVVRTCNLGQGAVAEFAEIVGRAERARNGKVAPANLSRSAENLALALYRAGRFEEARRAAQGINAALQANWPRLALLDHGVGRIDSARAWLRRFDTEYAGFWSRVLARPEKGMRISRVDEFDLVDLVECLILRREAEQKIAGANLPDDPWLHLLRGKIYTPLGEPDKSVREIEAAIAARPDDPSVLRTAARLLVQNGMSDRALAYLSTLVERNSRDPGAWIARGQLLAERGEHPKADADFARAAALVPDALSTFINAGWWVVGPYPENLALDCPPEHDPSPSRPVGAVGGGGALKWRAVPTEGGGRIRLRPLFWDTHFSVYLMTYVYAPQESSATLFVGGREKVRLWLNGERVHESASPMSTPGRWRLDRVPVTLRAGRNTVLAKVNHIASDDSTTPFYFYLRLADDPLDRGDALADMGLWTEAAPLYAKGPYQATIDSLELYRRRATLLLAAGDRPGYRQVCDEMLALYGNTTVSDTAETVAYLCGLSPDPVADPALLKPLAELGRKRNASRPLPFSHRTAGALSHYRAGEFDTVIKDLGDPKENDAFPEAWTLLALAQHRRGHPQEARTSLARAEQWYDRVTQESIKAVPFRLPGLPDWWKLAAFQVLLREARSALNGAESADRNLESLQARARLELERRDKSTADYDHALMVQPDEIRLLRARAHRLADLKRWQPALADIERGLDLEPRDLQLRSERNRIFIATGRADELAVEYTARLDRAQAGPTWDTERNKVALELARSDEVFSRLAQQRPDDPYLWIGRGRHNALQSRWKEAAAHYARAVKAREPSIDWFEYAAVLGLTGDVAGYRNFVTWADQRAGTSADPYTSYVLARMSAIVPDSPVAPSRAVAWAEQAIKSDESDLFSCAMGLTLYRAGRYQEAIRRLEVTETKGTEKASSAQNKLVLAMAYFRINDLAAARGSLARAIAAIPEPNIEGLVPADWLAVQLLRREAESLIPRTSEAAKTPAEP